MLAGTNLQVENKTAEFMRKIEQIALDFCKRREYCMHMKQGMHGRNSAAQRRPAHPSLTQEETPP